MFWYRTLSPPSNRATSITHSVGQFPHCQGPASAPNSRRTQLNRRAGRGWWPARDRHSTNTLDETSLRQDRTGSVALLATKAPSIEALVHLDFIEVGGYDAAVEWAHSLEWA